MLLKHYLQIGWRHLVKHKTISLINIFGLAVGLAAVILIALFLRYEFSYDSFWINSDKLHRITSTLKPPGGPLMRFEGSPTPLASLLEEQLPQITKVTRVIADDRSLYLRQGEYRVRQNLVKVDADFLSLFDLKPIYGDPSSALQRPDGLVITRSLAERQFGSADVLGRTLTLDSPTGKVDVKVAAVIEDIPKNSDLKLDALSLINRSQLGTNWFPGNQKTYVLLAPGADPTQLESALNSLLDRHADLGEIPGIDKASDFLSLSLTHASDLHFSVATMGVDNGSFRATRPMLLAFATAAALILIIACINTMNLSIARASTRAREIALRKASGASRIQIIFQFLGESVLLTMLSFIIAIALVEITLPSFRNFVGSDLRFSYHLADLLQLIGLVMLLGIAAGCYPALVLSAMHPATTLKANRSRETKASSRFRQSLVVTQFSAMIALSIAAGVIFLQLNYLNKRDLGINRDNVLVINQLDNPRTVSMQQFIIQEFSNHPQVETISRSSYGFITTILSTIRTPDMPKENSIAMSNQYVDYDYFATYEIPFIAGRAFTRPVEENEGSLAAYQSATPDTQGIIINQAAAKAFNIPVDESSLGRIFLTDASNTNTVRYELKGIVADAQFYRPENEIEPEVYILATEPPLVNSISLRFSGNPQTLLEDIQALWRQRVAEEPMRYVFVSDYFAGLYTVENNQAGLFSAFAVLTMLIACLGLYALASLTTAHRVKEIGVRKALGAKVSDILMLMLWQFSVPVLLANLIAWPVAFYFMSDWLSGFTYRIGTVDIFLVCLIAATGAILIAWGTVASNAFRAARARPVKALRYE